MPTKEEKEYLRISKQVLTDGDPFMVMTDCASCWMLVSAIQLAWRHPGLDPRMKGILRDIGDTYQAPIAIRHPGAIELLEMGWDESKDIPND